MIVIGLDCAAPRLVFDRYRDAMPHVSALMESGSWGVLRSSEPPITVPAWTCMVSGRDAGELGLYGFRNRVAGENDPLVGGQEDRFDRHVAEAVLGEDQPRRRPGRSAVIRDAEDGGGAAPGGGGGQAVEMIYLIEFFVP